MDPQDRKTLERLLLDLMSAQDDVTHLNEQGPQWESDVYFAIQKRDRIRRGIMAFVEALVEGYK